MKIGANLGGATRNSVIIRNWPTCPSSAGLRREPRTALYSGNLGYGHDIELLVEACGKLRAAGYRITMRSDGRGAWQAAGLVAAGAAAKRSRQSCATISFATKCIWSRRNPKITQAIFPSKIWNSLAAEARIGLHRIRRSRWLRSWRPPGWRRSSVISSNGSHLIATAQNGAQPNPMERLEPALA